MANNFNHLIPLSWRKSKFYNGTFSLIINVLKDPLHKGQLLLCFFQVSMHYLWKYFAQVGHFSKISVSLFISIKQIEHYVSDFRSIYPGGIIYDISEENLLPNLLTNNSSNFFIVSSSIINDSSAYFTT